MSQPRAYDLIVVGRGPAGIAMLSALARGGFRGGIALIGRVESEAFDACQPWHLLNTRVNAMDMDAPAGDGFQRFLAQHGLAFSATDFAPRAQFGAYARAQLDNLRPQLDLHIHDARANAITPDPRGFCLALHNGQTVVAPNVVLALGFLPRAQRLHPRAQTPWTAQPVSGAAFIIGAGLSGLDSAQSLLQLGHTGPIILASRRRLWPLAHPETPLVAPTLDLAWPENPSGATLMRAIRRAIAHHGPHDVLDALRPRTAAFWAGLPARVRMRILTSARQDLWSTLRHRAPPSVMAGIDAAKAAGQIQHLAEPVIDVDLTPQGDFSVTTRNQVWRAASVIDARGPSVDLCAHPLIANLIDAGLTRRSPTGFGVMADATLAIAILSAQRVYAIGAAHFGERLETTAFPELRAQASQIAEAINAHAQKS